jgi:hypothetical protein
MSCMNANIVVIIQGQIDDKQLYREQDSKDR